MKPPRRFAEGTAVPVARTKAEIESIVRRHGATAFATLWERDRFVVMFEMRQRRVRLEVPSPDPKEFQNTKAWDAEERRRWRVLLIVLKGKLELVASNDADFDSEFLCYLVMPNGQTVGQRVLPELEHALTMSEGLPPLLPAGPS
jgi:tRNA nucleotidyltransferase/poly(A) polymerase